jgi:hypothetical protein
MLDRRSAIMTGVALALTGIAAFATRALAHHGWEWAEGELVDLSGVIKSAKLGNPHGLLTVTAKDGDWTVEVGQPWRNARAGLKDSMLVKGAALTIRGNRTKDPKQKVMKAVRIVIAGKNYDLYPERLS